MAKIGKTISLDQNIWSEIDKKRGFVSRSSFVANILVNYFGTSKSNRGEKS
jgi:metal-responsive CopG/Arc/MetJ family transcriptional regulator